MGSEIRDERELARYYCHCSRERGEVPRPRIGAGRKSQAVNGLLGHPGMEVEKLPPRVPRLYASNEQGSNGEGNFGGYAGHMKQTGEDAKDRDLEVVHTIG